MRGVLLDIDGVLVLSWEPLPGAIEATRAVRDAGLAVRFLTNTTSRTRVDVGRTLRAHGFAVDDAEVVTAGVATGEYLRREHPDGRCLVLNAGPLDDLEPLRVAGPDEPVDVVVIGSGGPPFTWDAVNRAARALVGGAAFVAMHGSLTWNTKDGICVDGGAYVAALERATGRPATVVGKPSPTMFREALAGMALDASETVMVGDDLENDVLAAQRIGIRGVLVRTGKFRAEALEASGERPDAVLDSVAELPSLLG